MPAVVKGKYTDVVKGKYPALAAVVKDKYTASDCLAP